jgi:hypothetical protein
VPQLAPCASSGRSWQLWLARRSQGRDRPTGRPTRAAQGRRLHGLCTFFVVGPLARPRMVAEGERLRARSALARRAKPLKAKAAHKFDRRIHKFEQTVTVVWPLGRHGRPKREIPLLPARRRGRRHANQSCPSGLSSSSKGGSPPASPLMASSARREVHEAAVPICGNQGRYSPPARVPRPIGRG